MKLRRVSIGSVNGHTRQCWEIRCDCGITLICASFTNTCDCGADYGPNGDRLAPREHWGEETGESASDVLVPDDVLVRALMEST